VDAFSVFALMFFLGVLLYGGVESTKYALEYGERSYSAWRPYMAPIKIIMCFGIVLMLLQAIAEFFKDIARIRGEDL
jgi:TRAP-type mannitol/chloroaromatic compound transport system permease small subunit